MMCDGSVGGCRDCLEVWASCHNLQSTNIGDQYSCKFSHRSSQRVFCHILDLGTQLFFVNYLDMAVKCFVIALILTEAHIFDTCMFIVNVELQLSWYQNFFHTKYKSWTRGWQICTPFHISCYICSSLVYVLSRRIITFSFFLKKTSDSFTSDSDFLVFFLLLKFDITSIWSLFDQ